MEEISEEALRLVVHICGPHSAAARAIENAEARRSAGQTVKFFKGDMGALIVQGYPAAAAQPLEQPAQGDA